MPLRFILIFLFSLSPCLRVFSQTEAVIKTKATDALTESIVIPTGKSITINSGGTITNNGTATGFGGGGTWGSITGTLSNQTDLSSALALKATLASPTFTGTVTMPSLGLVFPDGGGVIGMEFGGGLNKITLKTASLSGVKTVTIPATTGTIITTGDTGTVTNNMLAGSIDLTTKVTGALPAANMPALTGDVTTSAGAVATTLATVNSNVGSFTNASITVNAKGLITAASSGAASAATIAIATKTDTFSSTSTSFTDVPDLSVTITTTADTDKVRITYSIAWAGSAGSEVRQLRFVRDGSAIFVGTSTPGSRIPALAGTETVTNSNSVTNLGGTFFDSPAAAGTYVYKVQVRTSSAAAPVYINVSVSNGNNGYSTLPASQIAAERVPQ